MKRYHSCSSIWDPPNISLWVGLATVLVKRAWAEGTTSGGAWQESQEEPRELLSFPADPCTESAYGKV